VNYTRPQRLVALLYGLACHLAFAAAVGVMMWKLYRGLSGGPSLPFPQALAWDALLILQFPLIHSLLLTPAGARFLGRLAPLGLGADLKTTTFALVASLQILFALLAWSPLGPVWREFHGPLALFSSTLYLGGWLLLLKSMSDAGLGVQMGYLGWLAVFRNQRPAYPPFRERGSLRYSRHPMYLAYAIILWTGPVWSLDHLLLAGVWSLYCVLAPLHKESRTLRRSGPAYASYRKRVPYFIPRFRSSP